MRSPTSFFNSFVLRKNLTRFAPVWVLYSVCLLLIVSLNIHYAQEEVSWAITWAGMVNELAIYNLLYAGLCALLLFGDLFRSRLCNALHAMPIRREGWLLTHTLSGILFALIPYALAAIVIAVQIPNYLWVAGVWFAVTMLQFLFFFGMGVFSVMCAGNLLGMGAVYFILNFFFMLVYGLFYYLYRPLLHGIAFDSFEYERLVPVLYLQRTFLVDTYQMYKGVCSFTPGYWRYLLLCAVFGVLTWLLGLLLYRRRKLECAGDFVAFRPVAPVFLIFYTLGMGALLFLLDGATRTVADYICLGVGIVIGFFTGKMLLQKQLRVFRPKAFIQLAILLVVLSGSMVITWLDPTGITYYVPKTEDVTGMRIYAEESRHFYEFDIVAKNALATEEADINALRDLHQQMTLERNIHPDAYCCNISVVYYLSDGSTCKRTYPVDRDSQLGLTMEKHLSDYRQVFFTDDWETYTESVLSARMEYFDGYNEQIMRSFSREELTGLLQALKADCDAGTMAQAWAYYRNDFDQEEVCWITVESGLGRETMGTDYYTQGTREVSLRISSDCVNTLAFLDAHTEINEPPQGYSPYR